MQEDERLWRCGGSWGGEELQSGSDVWWWWKWDPNILLEPSSLRATDFMSLAPWQDHWLIVLLLQCHNSTSVWFPWVVLILTSWMVLHDQIPLDISTTPRTDPTSRRLAQHSHFLADGLICENPVYNTLTRLKSTNEFHKVCKKCSCLAAKNICCVSYLVMIL